MFKVKTFDELRGVKYFHEAEVKPTWRQRLMKLIVPGVFREAFSLSRENERLRAQLLSALMACEDAGRNGLILYAENEELRERVETPGEKAVARLHDIERLKRENFALTDKLKRAYEDHNRLREQIDKWIVQFGEPK
jgi:hypothetical protein